MVRRFGISDEEIVRLLETEAEYTLRKSKAEIGNGFILSVEFPDGTGAASWEIGDSVYHAFTAYRQRTGV